MRIAGTVQDSIVDGPGFRFVVFTQGCPHRCEGCHNPESHDPCGGEEKDTSDIIKEMLRNPMTDGLTLSGGEPFEQAETCAQIAQAAREAGLNVWVYSGWTFEELIQAGREDYMQLLRLTDVLIDGRFDLSQRSLTLKWKGSRNQRVLNVPQSLTAGVPVPLEE